MVTIRLNNTKYQCPICWEETTTAQYQRVKVVDEPDLVKLFSALLGVQYNAVNEANADDIETILYQVASYLFNQDEYFRSYPIPQTFTVGKVTVPIPFRIESMTIEQTLYLRREMKNGKILEQFLSLAIAVYLQPLVDKGSFHVERMKEIESEILTKPISETFPLGFFLLNRLNRYGKSGLYYLPDRIKAWMKSNLTQRNWLDQIR